VQCGAWFHYERDSSGVIIAPTPDNPSGGTWLLGLTGACAGVTLAIWQNAYSPTLGSVGTPQPDNGAFDQVGFPTLTQQPNMAIVADSLTLAGYDPNTPTTQLYAIAQWHYDNAFTYFTVAQGPADDFAIACSDVVPPGVICPPGYQYDPKSESCQPIIGIINPLPPPPPTCPPGTIWNPKTETCQPTNPPPPTCPPGTQWDPITQTCKPITTPPPPPQGDVELDEIGQCCVQTNANLVLIQQEIQQLQLAITGNGQQLDPVTCGQLTGLFYTLNVSLFQIAQAIAAAAGGGTTPVDLTAVVNALLELAAAAQSYPPVWNAIAAALGTQLGNIAAAIAANPTDLTGVVNALNSIGSDTTIAQQFRDVLVAEGLISGEDAQLMSGSPSLLAIIEVLIPELHDILRLFHIIGADVPGATIFSAIPYVVAWLQQQWPAVKAMLQGLLTTATTPPAQLYLGEIESVGESIASWAGLPAIAALKFVGAPAEALADVTPGDQVSAAQQTFGRAWAMGELAHMLAIISGIVPNGFGPAFSGWAAEVSTAAGFHEIAQAIHRSVYGIAFARPTAYQVNASTRGLYPAWNIAQGLYAQGLITAAQLAECEGYGGLRRDYVTATEAAAYRGLNARQMLRLVETGLFSDAEIADELTFSAMRPVSQARMLRAAPYLATAPQRTSLHAAIDAAAVAGLLADSDVTAQVDAAESNDDRDSLILARVHLQQLIQEAKDFETEYTALYLGGIDDDPTFRANLAGIGLQPWKVNTVAAKAEARANSTLRRKTIADAAALTKATEAKERADAVKNFVTGNIDAAGLGVALLGTGLTATQVAAWTDLAVLQKGGGLKWIFGLQLPAAEATLLRNRVTALTDQRKRLQIDDPTYVAQLQALGIGDRYVNALDAAADAMISPKTSAFPIPVKTN